MQPNQPVFEVLGTLQEMLFPHRDNADLLYEANRKKGKHSLQVLTDVIAYAQNIQIRLLLPAALKNLPGQIKTLITAEKSKNDVATILRHAGLDEIYHKQLYNPEFLKNVYGWMAALVTEKGETAIPPALTSHWLNAMVALLPHIETKVFLTSLSNPLPAHALCSMQSTWALYVILSMWDKMQNGRDEYVGNDPNYIVRDTFGINGFISRPMPKFSIPTGNGGQQDCVLLVGPAFEQSNENDNERDYHYRYKMAFRLFNDGLAKAGFSSELHSTVNEQEITDALLSRIAFPAEEVILRSQNALNTLRLLLTAQISHQAMRTYHYALGDAQIFTRTALYTTAVLGTWLIRWGDMICSDCAEGEQLLLYWDNRSAAFLITFLGIKEGKPDWEITIVPYDKEKLPEEQITGVMPIITKLALVEAKKPKKSDRIDRIEILYNRVKERQNAAWSRQIIAVNNLLIRHGSASAEWGLDEIVGEDPLPGASTIKARLAGHLLKGFGQQICKYLADITRADLADIFWLDYSQTPPRLIHVDGYARAIPHIVQSDQIIRGFDEWAWRNSPDAPANLRKISPSQAYRVIATGREDSHPEHGTVTHHEFFVDSYGALKPQDSTALPLLNNNRTIGVLVLGGLVPYQFNRHLLSPLQTIANLVASTMYQQNQLWQMRRLNSLFATSDISLVVKNSSKDSNVLKNVVRCLTNIFLCPVVQIWLCDELIPFTFRLSGYNWPGSTQNYGPIPTFDYRSPSRRNHKELNPEKDSFISLALDLWATTQESDSAPPSLAKFVQGQYNPTTTEKYTCYSTQAAHDGIVNLGPDFLPMENLPSDAPAHMLRREQIFRKNEMRDIMAFALVRRQDRTQSTHWETVGAITLHDRASDFLERKVPWDKGWCPVVAHIQTYLPNLFAQAEILSNPVAAAQAYYLHAARALTVSIKDTANALHNDLQRILAPNNSIRHDINSLFIDKKPKDFRQLLLSAPKILSNAWDELQKLRQTDWMSNLDQIAELMHQHKNIYITTKDIAVGNENFSLLAEIETLSQAFNEHFRSKHVFATVAIPDSVRLRLPLIQLRIVLYDLIHNAAKYSTPNGVLEISWIEKEHMLQIRNQGPFDVEFDLPELLVQYRVRGSAAKIMPDIRKNITQDRKGTGTGLWGCKVVCGQIGVKFELTVTEMKNAKSAQPIAWYVVKLTFQKQMRLDISKQPPENFY